MKCPYTVNRHITTQTVIEYNDEGNQKSYTEYQSNIASFAKCLKKECGAYNADTEKCEYKC